MSVKLESSKPPTKPADVPLRIYSNPICPYAQRARLVAAAKGVKHEIIQVHLRLKPEWFLEEINPFGKVPVIEHNGHIIRESAVVFDYIDEIYGDQKLWPSDAYKKAQSKLILNDFGEQFTPNYYKYFFNKQDDGAAENIFKFLKSVETIIAQYGGPFILGNEVTAIDLLIWPWFERIPALTSTNPDFSAIYTQEKLPVIWKWVEAMKEVDAVKATSLSPEAHGAFIAKAKETGGNHDYSVLGKDFIIYVKA